MHVVVVGWQVECSAVQCSVSAQEVKLKAEQLELTQATQSPLFFVPCCATLRIFRYP